MNITESTNKTDTMTSRPNNSTTSKSDRSLCPPKPTLPTPLDLYALATRLLQRPSPVIPVALDTLRNLLNHPSLASTPLLHAMTHALVAVCVPLSTTTRSEFKTHHLDKAEDIIWRMRNEKHRSDACQGCMMAGFRKAAGKSLKYEDDNNGNKNRAWVGNECLELLRLERVCTIERKRIEALSWRYGGL